MKSEQPTPQHVDAALVRLREGHPTLADAQTVFDYVSPRHSGMRRLMSGVADLALAQGIAELIVQRDNLLASIEGNEQ